MTDSEIRGLIFDCDGTLVDTMPLHWRAWNSVCKRHGIVFPEERFYALGGVPSVKILRMLKEEQGLTNGDDAVKEAVAELLRLKALLPVE